MIREMFILGSFIGHHLSSLAGQPRKRVGQSFTVSLGDANHISTTILQAIRILIPIELYYIYT